MKNISFENHTIILLIGPSNCGKSYFAKKIMQMFDIKSVPYTYLSSDDIRRELLGDASLNKYDTKMLYASKQAFTLLYDKLNLVTQFPISTPYVIIDSTGLQKEFRDKIIAIAKDNHYNVSAVLFKYDDRDDYFKFSDEYTHNHVIAKHIKYFNENTVKQIGKKEYRNVYKITSPNDVNNIQIEIPQDVLDYKQDHYLGYNDNEDYYIIGDVHASYDDLKNFITQKCNETISIDSNDILSTSKNTKIILIGDIVDKGNQLKEVIEFVYKNINSGILKLIIGNHENFVYKYLKGLIKGDYEKLINEYFDSIKIFETDEELKQKFYTIVELSKHFYYGDNFFVCHSPAELKYLGKKDNSALKKQQTMFLDKRQKDFETKKLYNEYLKEQLSHCLQTSRNDKPIIFGHLAFDRAIKIGSYIGIDTGAVYGNYLTGVYCKNNNRYPDILSVKSVNPFIEDSLMDSKCMLENKDEFIDLSPYEKRRLKFVLENNVNYISGTMAPCDSDIETQNLESLNKGLEYYKLNGIKEVVLEPKYMGSRLQIYLDCVDVNNSYAITRNGFKIKPELNEKLLPIYNDLFVKFISKDAYEKGKYKYIIFDGEILPWSFLGEGLITERFVPVQQAVERELQFLSDNKFEEKIKELSIGDYASSNFKVEIQNDSKKLLNEFPHAKYETYKNYAEYSNNHIPLDLQKEYYKIYKEQIDLFCSTTAQIEYKIFSILKFIEQNGNEYTFSNNEFLNDNSKMFDLCNPNQKCIVIDLKKENYLEEAIKYFNTITLENKMEGIVIKPRYLNINSEISPYIKCRNMKYLTMVYGYDYTFPKKHNKLINKKRVKGKNKLAISEYKLATKMIKTPMNNLNSPEYKKLIIHMIAEQHTEKTLDPRL